MNKKGQKWLYTCISCILCSTNALQWCLKQIFKYQHLHNFTFMYTTLALETFILSHLLLSQLTLNWIFGLGSSHGLRPGLGLSGELGPSWDLDSSHALSFVPNPHCNPQWKWKRHVLFSILSYTNQNRMLRTRYIATVNWCVFLSMPKSAQWNLLKRTQNRH